MELIEYLHIIKKRIWIIVSITVAAAVVSGILSFFVLSPVYEARSSLIIGRATSGAGKEVQYNDILMYQKLVQTYGELLKSDLVVSKAIEELNYHMSTEELKSNLTVTPKGDTQIIEVAIENEDPKVAYNLTNSLVKAFVEQSGIVMNSEDVRVLDVAKLPNNPIKPRKLLNIAIAGLLGLMVSLGLVFLMEYLDNTIKTEDDIEKYLAITVLATVPYVKDKER